MKEVFNHNLIWSLSEVDTTKLRLRPNSTKTETMMDGSEIVSVAVDGSSGSNHAVVTQAVLDQLQQIQHPHQELLLASAAVNNGANVATAITVQEPQRGIEMIEFFRKQREREKFCDVIFHVHGKQFFAHRMVLAAGSAYFDSIFKSTKTIRENLAVACREPEVFQVFLNYFYTGSVTLDKSNVGELIRLANQFLVGKLKSYCAEFLERFMDAENCLQIKYLAEKFQLVGLAKAATIFVQNNLGEVINHEIMMELPPKQIENFVTEKAWGVPQDAAVKFMSRWVCHDLGARERDFKQLLTNIDWNSMDPNIIVDYIDQEPLYGSSERCFYYVLHSLAEKGIQVQKYEQMYQALQQRFGQELEPALGFGDNLLQMAFNSAMEGLTDSTSLLMSDGRENNKWVNGNDPLGKPPRDERSQRKVSVSLEQRRKRILAKINRERYTQKWIRLRSGRPKKRRLAYNERLAESSGDEECDPIQTSQGYRCHLCVFVAKKVSRLERHMSTIHAHDVTYRCSECGFTCKWNREYFLHMKSHYEGPPYKCQACGYQCQKIGSLISHKVTHVELKPYQCCECDYKCRSKANLAAHLKTHNNEKPYRCNICGRTFASKNSLDQHAVGHNSEKIYACTQCVFSSKYLNHFTAHKKSHHGVGTPSKKGEVYRCHDSQCKYTTSKKSQLDSHMRSHAGVRPHICSICGRRFLEKSHLVRHERIHFNERPFKCEECDYASTRRDKLKEHKTRHHGLNASEKLNTIQKSKGSASLPNSENGIPNLRPIAKSPYKPRPHKSNKQSNFVGDQNLVYAKKSTVQQSQQQVSQPSQQSPQVQEQTATVTTGSSGELEFIIPHSHTEGGSARSAFAQLVSGQGGTIDLQQMANSAGLVQLRPFQPGKSNEVQLASIPTSISSADLQRTLGVKLEDLQAQGLLSGRAIKLEELVPGQNISSSGVAQGLGVGRIQQHGTTTTMVLTPAQLQQFTQAVSVSAANSAYNRTSIPITIAPVTSGAAVNNAQGTLQSTTSTANNQAGAEYSGISTLLF